MGVGVLNLKVFTDHATPDRYSAVELHMELPIPHIDANRVQEMLSNGEWDMAQSYLVAKYPHHSALLTDWLANSRNRQEVTVRSPKLAAVS